VEGCGGGTGVLSSLIDERSVLPPRARTHAARGRARTDTDVRARARQVSLKEVYAQISRRSSINSPDQAVEPGFDAVLAALGKPATSRRRRTESSAITMPARTIRKART
jgi:hypothetical protein